MLAGLLEAFVSHALDAVLDHAARRSPWVFWPLVLAVLALVLVGGWQLTHAP